MIMFPTDLGEKLQGFMWSFSGKCCTKDDTKKDGLKSEMTLDLRNETEKHNATYNIAQSTFNNSLDVFKEPVRLVRSDKNHNGYI